MTTHDDSPRAYRRTRAADGPRTLRLTVYLSPGELATIKTAAERHRMDPAAWLGRTGVSAARERAMPADDALRALLEAVQDVATEASRQGRNINQIAVKLHSTGQLTAANERNLEHALDLTDETLRSANEVIRLVKNALST